MARGVVRSPEALASGQIVGSYRLVQRLGQGGMATTWLAEATADGQRVVLKFPDVAQIGDPAMYERFRRETEIGRRVNHPSVPRCLEMREDWQRPYLVMEFVAGKLLSDVVSRRGALPVSEATHLTEQLLEALTHLHNHGIVHRDLKPENLVVSPEGQLRIIDFGLALLEGSQRVTWRGFSGLAGTPAYMAPEQIRGERGGPQADVYAAGAILYEMLAGEPPYSGDNPLAIMYRAINEPLPPIRRNDLPPGLWHVLQRALHRDRAVRYRSAEDFLRDLRAPEEVAAPPMDKPGRSRRLPFGLGGWGPSYVVAIVACVIIIVVALVLVHARG